MLPTTSTANEDKRSYGLVWLLHLALLWQILSGTGFPNQFFCDSWVVGFGGADHGWKDVGLERRAWTLSQAVCGSVGSQGAATNVSTLRVGADRSWRS